MGRYLPGDRYDNGGTAAAGAGWSLPFWQSSLSDDLQQIPMRQLAGFGMFIPAALNYFSLGYFLAGICTLLSSWDRYRWRTIGLMMGFYVVQMLAEILGQAFEKISWVRQLSFFRAYEPVMFVSEAASQPELGWSWLIRDSAGKIVDIGPLTCDAILITLGTLGFAAAMAVFCRRDLPAPL